MSRGPELELSTIKDVEDLKHTLAQAMVHVPNDVLRRAIILPKDMDTSNGRYASPKDLLPKNPQLDAEMIHHAEEMRKLMAKETRWKQKTFPEYYKKKKDDDEETAAAEQKPKKTNLHIS